MKAQTAAPAPRSATPPVATAATLPRAPRVAAAMVPEPGNIATLAAVSIPESECRLAGDGAGDIELGVSTGVGVVVFDCGVKEGCREVEEERPEELLQGSILYKLFPAPGM